MTVTRLGTCTGVSTAPSGGGGVSAFVTAPSGIPAGSTAILLGYQFIARPLSVSDDRSNTWTHRAGSNAVGIILFDCQITTALASGDHITLNLGTGGGQFIFLAVFYSQCIFDTMAQQTFTGTAAAGPTIHTSAGGGPVFGAFGIYNSAAFSPTPSLGSSGQGAGYGVENTTFSSDPGSSKSVHSFCWESKIGVGGVDETATGTLNTAGTNEYGATIAYKDTSPTLPNPVSMVM